jgi:hypothetical protein
MNNTFFNKMRGGNGGYYVYDDYFVKVVLGLELIILNICLCVFLCVLCDPPFSHIRGSQRTQRFHKGHEGRPILDGLARLLYRYCGMF